MCVFAPVCVYVWRPGKTLHNVPHIAFGDILQLYRAVFPEHFAFYLKKISLLVAEIWSFKDRRGFERRTEKIAFKVRLMFLSARFYHWNAMIRFF